MSSYSLKSTVLSLVLGLISTQALACLDEGRVTHLSFAKNTYMMKLESGNEYTIIGKKNPLIPMVKNSIQYGKEICLTNKVENYPIQLVAGFREFEAPTMFPENCVKKGFVRKVYVNSKYDWFFLEDGFSIRVIHSSKLTPQLYQAAFSKKEVCVTEMNLDATDGTWGIPRDMVMPE